MRFLIARCALVAVAALSFVVATGPTAQAGTLGDLENVRSAGAVTSSDDFSTFPVASTDNLLGERLYVDVTIGNAGTITVAPVKAASSASSAATIASTGYYQDASPFTFTADGHYERVVTKSQLNAAAWAGYACKGATSSSTSSITLRQRPETP